MRRRSYLPALAGSFAIVLVLALVIDALYDGNSSVKATAIGSITYLEEKLDELVFPKDKVIDVKVSIDEEDFQDMLNNAAAEEIKAASVEYNGIKLSNIGFRTKGNLSLSSVVNSDSDRYSFKLHFDEYISSQSLYGVHAINLNNSYSDPTYMREVLAYELAEQLGLPTPKYSYVNLYINDELWGFYLAVEQIGNSYLERNFGNATGSLYKAVMGNGTDLVWVDDSRESYSALVQKSDYADEEALINMIDELNNGSDYEQVLEVENVLKYIALNVVTNNSDSYIGQTKHNYYLYEQNGIFSVLPWDYNMAFGGMANMGNGGRRGGFGDRGGFGRDVNMDQTDGNDQAQGAEPGAQLDAMQAGKQDTDAYAGVRGRFGGFGGDISVFDPAGGLERPLIDKLLAVPEYLAMYTAYVREALEGYLATDNFNSRVDELAELIREYVKQDPRPFYSYEAFESGIDSLKTSNANNVAKFMQELGEGDQTASARINTASGDVTIAELAFGEVTPAQNSLAQFQPRGMGEVQLPPDGIGDAEFPQGDMRNRQFPPDGMGDAQFPPGAMGEAQIPPGAMGDAQFPPGATGEGQSPPAGMGDAQFPQDAMGNGQPQQSGNAEVQAQQEEGGNEQIPPSNMEYGTTQQDEGDTAQLPQANMGEEQFPFGDMGNGQFPGFPGGGGQGGGNFPGFGGGGGFPGNMQGTAPSTISDEQLKEELIEIGVSLGVMALAAVFIVTFRRRRL